MKRSAREATAYHEAGHAIAWWRYGIPIRDVTIVPGDGFAGQVRHGDLWGEVKLDVDDPHEHETNISKEVVVCLAGSAAQRRFSRRSWRTYHGQSDHVRAVDLASRLNEDDDRAKDLYLRWTERRADFLVKRYWPFITALAERLLVVRTLTGDDVLKVISEVALR
jgi:hypothetical protein